MTALVTRSFKVDFEAWENFVKASTSYGALPSELLRELVTHVDAAVKGVQSGRLKSFDGDVARLIRTEFPQLSPFQLEMMANILIEAALLKVEVQGKGETEANPEKSIGQ